MSGKFSVQAWAAFAPGLEDEAAWRDWAHAPAPPRGDAMPALAEMPAMQRRRVEKLGRMALQVAWRCQPDADAALPLVFASRHGDIGRTFDMLAALARDEPLSPTHFGLSTHNAIAAQYTIARGLTGNYLAVSAGDQPAEAAVTEALGLLEDGAAGVLVVVYDGAPPSAYARYRDEPDADYAWAWRLGPPREGQPVLSLAAAGSRAEYANAGAPGLPHGLDVLRFFLAGDRHLDSPDGQRRWTRHA